MSQQHSILNHSIDPDMLMAHPRLRQLLWEGRFGLEKEHVRCTADGHLALSPHPEALGNKADHPYITTDFSESQVEMITPPMPSLREAHGFMQTLHQLVNQALPEGELLWMQSMPPVLPDESQIPVARFEGSSRYKTEYRERLSAIYGRGRQMISGSHFNISLTEAFFEEYARVVPQPVEELKNLVYMKMVRNLMRYRWWLVAALGRSPVADPSLKLKAFDSDQLFSVCCAFGISIRSSRIGYRNPHPLETSYSSLESYLESLDAHICSGKLLNRNELYMPIRLKLEAASSKISHLEIRLLDLDPLDPVGLPLESLYLIHQFCIFCLLEPETDAFDLADQQRADELQNRVAVASFSPKAVARCCELIQSVELRQDALRLFNKLENILSLQPAHLPEGPAMRAALEKFGRVLREQEPHSSAQMIEQVEQAGFVPFFLQCAQRSRDSLADASFRFHGLEDMELSTQLLLREAVKRGVHFDILDRRENFVRLHKLGKEEYVMQATRTSLDRYSNVLLMNNKLTTKLVLARAGIRVPEGFHFTRAEDAFPCWDAVQGRAVVVKPKSTNFGIGITILKENQSREDFQRAVQVAFKEDQDILVEFFVPGKEYRFFLIESQVAAILHRVPANVTGDGVHTIEELVAIKNLDPLRGKGYRTPLEKIQLRETEIWFLGSQGLHVGSIPLSGERVFLRENSNISTGGDSIDMTERIHASYHEIASRASRALGVRITGLDMMIEDIHTPARADNYAIIEMNFNPAIHIHCFPYEGKNRHLDKALLGILGFV